MAEGRREWTVWVSDQDLSIRPIYGWREIRVAEVGVSPEEEKGFVGLGYATTESDGLIAEPPWADATAIRVAVHEELRAGEGMTVPDGGDAAPVSAPEGSLPLPSPAGGFVVRFESREEIEALIPAIDSQEQRSTALWMDSKDHFVSARAKLRAYLGQQDDV